MRVIQLNIYHKLIQLKNYTKKRNHLVFFLILFFYFYIPFSNCFPQNIKKENLGISINTKYSEHWPVISPDGNTLFFIRDDCSDNIGSSDIWFSKQISPGVWTKALNVGRPLNTIDGSAVCSVSPDGNTLLLLGIYLKNGGVLYEGFSISQKTKEGWGFPIKLNIKNFYNLNNHWSAYMSNDGKKLFLGIERKDSFGDCDIYISFLENDGSWTEPMNLGNNINTKGREGDAFLAADNETLYFESNGHYGFGGQDIFFSKRLDDTWKNWTAPVNLGKDINTNKDDQEYFITANGEYAYFASEKNSYGGFDIFRIRLPEKIKPKPVVLIYGKVLNSKTNECVSANIRYGILPTGVEAGIANSDPDNGSYKIVLPYGKNYSIIAKADGYFSISDNIDLSEIKENKQIEKNLYLVPIELGEVIRLNNVFFDFDKYELKPESIPEMERVVSFLNANPSIIIELSGHTDNIGKSEYNLNLSYNRSNSVAEYLFSKGIVKERIIVVGYGDTKPIDTNETEEGRKNNRRVEFKIIKK